MNRSHQDRSKQSVRLAIAGVGNCASALVQGISFYTRHPTSGGLVTPVIGGYHVADVEIVAAFDVDRRKVGKPVREAIFSEPNCTHVFEENPLCNNVLVEMGPPHDGISEHMSQLSDADGFRISEKSPADIVDCLRQSQADVLVCYVPVGSERAARHYANACLEAGVALVNAMPAFIASDPSWSSRFKSAGLPVVGDDIKSQLGATILHRSIAQLVGDRGCSLESTYQLNFGGNTDFANMLDRERLTSKKLSKTRAVTSAMIAEIEPRQVHIGPSDHVPWLKDNKIAYIHINARGFANMPIEIEVKLSVEDSPNSAAVVLDAVRCAKLAMDRGIAGPLEAPSACYMKSPPRQFPEAEAMKLLAEFLM
jgi:myo-inositol-1-phosphate synthase